jgi:hypothetical protein
MAGRVSALAVLGLDPGADAAAIEQAYKRLIKQHHPDRDGGDSSRAAEINRAYRELRGGRAATDPLEFNDYFPGRRKRRWPIGLGLAIAAIAVVVFVIGSGVPLKPTLWIARTGAPVRHAAAVPNAHEAMDEPLHVTAIDASVWQALQMFRSKNERALADFSDTCLRHFREQPGTLMLDRCAAFDDAVVGLEDRDPLRDNGPFAPLAVTGRQWNAASSLSDDDLSIDERLDQIRLRVEVILTQATTPPSVPQKATSSAVPAPETDSAAD